VPTGATGTLRGALLGLLSAGVGLATAFGLSLTDKQQAAILVFGGAAALVAPFVGALFDHSNKQVAAREEAAATISTGQPSVAVRQAADIQARIDELTRQREALPK
jgi:hypothetical protein